MTDTNINISATQIPFLLIHLLRTAPRVASHSKSAFAACSGVGCRTQSLRATQNWARTQSWESLVNAHPSFSGQAEKCWSEPYGSIKSADLTTFTQTASAWHSLKTRMLRWRLPKGSPSKLGNVRAGFLAHPLSYNASAIASELGDRLFR